jgi:uncharacterized protein YbjT (DUF2867 family)
MPPQTFLITSATGSQGGATARELLLRGAKVHALVRDSSSSASKELSDLGVTLFQGTFFDIPVISEALVGVTGVFLNTFPTFQDIDGTGEIQQARNIVTAAKEAKTVTTFVVSTVYKASEKLEIAAASSSFRFLKVYLTQKAGVEEVVKEAEFEHWTVLRPDWLDYNYLTPASDIHYPEYRSKHILTTSYDPSYKKSHFDPYDVGKFAAAAFLDPQRFHGRTIELTGEPLTYEEVAKVLSKVSGVKVAVRYRSEEETREVFESGKLPVIELQIGVKEFGFDYDPKGLDEYEIQLGTLEEYLTRNKGRVLETLGVSAS